MLEPVMVETPHIFPHRCVLCTEGRGPIADSHSEIPGFGRLYMCRRCAKTYARLYGFAEGEKLDELEVAGVRLEEKERELAAAQEQLADAALREEARDKRITWLSEELEARDAHVSQLETTIREYADNARRASELVSS